MLYCEQIKRIFGVGDYDRRIRDESWEKTFQIQGVAKVHGNVKIETGDLLFFDGRNGLRNRGTSIWDGYVYPFNKISGATLALASNRNLAYKNFFGVAASFSESGVTEDIGAYLLGLFRYPLRNARSINVGDYILPAGSGVTLYNQIISVVKSGCSDIIGIVAKSGDFKSEVDTVIRSKIMGLNKFSDLKK
jgi:hypothetical protein